MEEIVRVCDDCDGNDPDCYCQREPGPEDCDHKGGDKYWCGLCIRPLIDV
jgi:hypothetical protein